MYRVERRDDGNRLQRQPLGLDQPDCYKGVKAELYLGLNIDYPLKGYKENISRQTFAEFIDTEVTPRFPDGVSVMDVPLGQWRSWATGLVIKERSKKLIIVMEDNWENQLKVRDLAETYAEFYMQEYMGLTVNEEIDIDDFRPFWRWFVQYLSALYLYLDFSKLWADGVYICGECGAENEIKPKEPIKCKDCAYRILYKKRTDRMLQFEAR
eukprot:gene10232-11923_t